MSDNSEIMIRLGLLQRAVEDLAALCEKGKTKPSLGDWLHEEAVVELTRLSKGTLRKLRDEGVISTSTISGKANYFRVSDIIKLLNENEKKG